MFIRAIIDMVETSTTKSLLVSFLMFHFEKVWCSSFQCKAIQKGKSKQIYMKKNQYKVTLVQIQIHVVPKDTTQVLRVTLGQCFQWARG